MVSTHASATNGLHHNRHQTVVSSLLDATALRDGLLSSLQSQPDAWNNNDIESLARLYDSEIIVVLDRLVPQRTVTCRRRLSNPWFDDECRRAKQSVRRLDRASSRASRAATATPSPVTIANAAVAAASWTTEHRAYCDLRRQKRESFWQKKVESERSTPHRLWQSIDVLMGRGHAPASTTIDAQGLHHFFDEKIAGVRKSTAEAPPLCFVPAPPFCVLSVDDVIDAVRKLPVKQCATNPLPTHLLKDNADVLAPFITELFNRSL